MHAARLAADVVRNVVRDIVQIRRFPCAGQHRLRELVAHRSCRAIGSAQLPVRVVQPDPPPGWGIRRLAHPPRSDFRDPSHARQARIAEPEPGPVFGQPRGSSCSSTPQFEHGWNNAKEREAMVTRQSASSPAERRGRRGHRPVPEEGVGQRLLLTVEEAADCLCVGRTYMFDLITRGVVASVRIGKLRRVRPEDLEFYVSSLR